MSSSSSGLYITSSDDEIVLRKLECLKELRDVTLELNERKSRLHGSLKAMDEESKYLELFKSEKGLIDQEKFAHTEELRLIHADLHQMESIIQESETEADHHLTLAKSLLTEWQQLADRANRIRFALGLDKLSSLPEEERLREELAQNSNKDEGYPHAHKIHDPMDGFKPLLMIANQLQPNHQPPFLFPTSSSASSSIDFKNSTASSSSGMGISSLANPINAPNSGLLSTGSSSLAEGHDRLSSFCQQTPPMKSCLTCLQQIHRNAPICPNCKAKSRSRNPKKPKRKSED